MSTSIPSRTPAPPSQPRPPHPPHPSSSSSTSSRRPNAAAASPSRLSTTIVLPNSQSYEYQFDESDEEDYQNILTTAMHNTHSRSAKPSLNALIPHSSKPPASAIPVPTQCDECGQRNLTPSQLVFCGECAMHYCLICDARYHSEKEDVRGHFRQSVASGMRNNQLEEEDEEEEELLSKLNSENNIRTRKSSQEEDDIQSATVDAILASIPTINFHPSLVRDPYASTNTINTDEKRNSHDTRKHYMYRSGADRPSSAQSARRNSSRPSSARIGGSSASTIASSARGGRAARLQGQLVSASAAILPSTSASIDSDAFDSQENSRPASSAAMMRPRSARPASARNRSSSSVATGREPVAAVAVSSRGSRPRSRSRPSSARVVASSSSDAASARERSVSPHFDFVAALQGQLVLSSSPTVSSSPPATSSAATNSNSNNNKSIRPQSARSRSNSRSRPPSAAAKKQDVPAAIVNSPYNPFANIITRPTSTRSQNSTARATSSNTPSGSSISKPEWQDYPTIVLPPSRSWAGANVASNSRAIRAKKQKKRAQPTLSPYEPDASPRNSNQSVTPAAASVSSPHVVSSDSTPPEQGAHGLMASWGIKTTDRALVSLSEEVRAMKQQISALEKLKHNATISLRKKQHATIVLNKAWREMDRAGPGSVGTMSSKSLALGARIASVEAAAAAAAAEEEKTADDEISFPPPLPATDEFDIIPSMIDAEALDKLKTANKNLREDIALLQREISGESNKQSSLVSLKADNEKMRFELMRLQQQKEQAQSSHELKVFCFQQLEADLVHALSQLRSSIIEKARRVAEKERVTDALDKETNSLEKQQLKLEKECEEMYVMEAQQMFAQSK